MTKQVLTIAIAGVLAAAAGDGASKTAKVTLNDANGKSVGTATLIEGKNGSGVTIKLDVKGLPAESTPSTSTRPPNAKAPRSPPQGGTSIRGQASWPEQPRRTARRRYAKLHREGQRYVEGVDR